MSSTRVVTPVLPVPIIAAHPGTVGFPTPSAAVHLEPLGGSRVSSSQAAEWGAAQGQHGTQSPWRETSVLAGVAVFCLWTAACGMGVSDEALPRPWANGQELHDPAYRDLEPILLPDQPVESSRFVLGTDRRVYYVARLSSRPWPMADTRYRQLLRSRGFFTEAQSTSGGRPGGRRYGYKMLVFRKGPVSPYSLLYWQFGDDDETSGTYGPRRDGANFPRPVQVDGRDLTVRLGSPAFEGWRQWILLPEEDVARVKELPFERYPGAVLAEVLSIGSHANWRVDLLKERGGGRQYLVRGTTCAAVLAHYANVLDPLGLPREFWDPTYRVAYRARGTADVALAYVSVASMGPVVMLPDPALLQQEVSEYAPQLLQDLPSDFCRYRVLIDFRTNADAAEYWSQEDQQKREALLRKEGRP